jgi:tellurite resistance protein TehA-like permease
MPREILLPIFWIILGPVGLGSLALMDLADASKVLNLINSIDTLKIAAIIFWSFGLWAILLPIAITFNAFSGAKSPLP